MHLGRILTPHFEEVSLLSEIRPTGGDRDNGLADVIQKGLRTDLESMTQAGSKEAPPGFEPGLADLQSAALPLG